MLQAAQLLASLVLLSSLVLPLERNNLTDAIVPGLAARGCAAPPLSTSTCMGCCCQTGRSFGVVFRSQSTNSPLGLMYLDTMRLMGPGVLQHK